MDTPESVRRQNTELHGAQRARAVRVRSPSRCGAAAARTGSRAPAPTRIDTRSGARRCRSTRCRSTPRCQRGSGRSRSRRGCAANHPMPGGAKPRLSLGEDARSRRSPGSTSAQLSAQLSAPSRLNPGGEGGASTTAEKSTRGTSARVDLGTRSRESRTSASPTYRPVSSPRRL